MTGDRNCEWTIVARAAAGKRRILKSAVIGRA